MSFEDHAAREKARTVMLNKLVAITDGYYGDDAPLRTVGIVTRLDYEHVIHPDRRPRNTQAERDAKLVVELKSKEGTTNTYWLHLFGESRWEIHGQGVFRP